MDLILRTFSHFTWKIIIKKKMVKDSNVPECPLQPHFTEMHSRGRVFPEALHHAMKKSAQRFVEEL